jgi:multidrug efflux pump subunit AcrA (membrane-fusion protein)
MAGEADDVLLVPVESLRELGPGKYAVFVLADGQPQLRPVEVGLMNLTYAEIVNGLNKGETVTTGIIDTGTISAE